MKACTKINYRIAFPVDYGTPDNSCLVHVAIENMPQHYVTGGRSGPLMSPSGAQFVWDRVPSTIQQAKKFRFEYLGKIKNQVPANIATQGHSDSLACALAVAQKDTPSSTNKIIAFSCAFNLNHDRSKQLHNLTLDSVTYSNDSDASMKSLFNKWSAANANQALALVLHSKDADILLQHPQCKDLQKFNIEQHVIETIQSKNLAKTPILAIDEMYSLADLLSTWIEDGMFSPIFDSCFLMLSPVIKSLPIKKFKSIVETKILPNIPNIALGGPAQCMTFANSLVIVLPNRSDDSNLLAVLLAHRLFKDVMVDDIPITGVISLGSNSLRDAYNLTQSQKWFGIIESNDVANTIGLHPVAHNELPMTHVYPVPIGNKRLKKKFPVIAWPITAPDWDAIQGILEPYKEIPVFYKNTQKFAKTIWDQYKRSKNSGG